MPELPAHADLAAYQRFVHDLEIENGFIDQTVLMKALLLGEELGELFRALRKAEGIKLDHTNAKVGSIDEELADIFIYLCSIANRYEINLEEAFRRKDEINQQRIPRQKAFGLKPENYDEHFAVRRELDQAQGKALPA